MHYTKCPHTQRVLNNKNSLELMGGFMLYSKQSVPVVSIETKADEPLLPPKGLQPPSHLCHCLLVVFTAAVNGSASLVWPHYNALQLPPSTPCFTLCCFTTALFDNCLLLLCADMLCHLTSFYMLAFVFTATTSWPASISSLLTYVRDSPASLKGSHQKSHKHVTIC
jgi:hypothetical protein